MLCGDRDDQVEKEKLMMQEREMTKGVMSIHSLNKYLFSVDRVVAAVLDAEAAAVNKTDTNCLKSEIMLNGGV